MRTETTTRTLYKFSELSPEAQQHALKEHARKGDLVLRRGYEYGYGEQYLQTAHELLHKAGYFGPEYWDFRDAMRNARQKFHVTCTDVQRKKEL